MDPRDPMGMFRDMLGGGPPEDDDPNAGKDYDPTRLAATAKKLINAAPTRWFGRERPRVKLGDKLIWKEGMKNRRFPPYGCPVIVTHVLTKNERLALMEGRTAKEGTGYPVELPDFVGLVALNTEAPGRDKNNIEPYPMEYCYDSRHWQIIG
jgi:hypothetical protein